MIDYFRASPADSAIPVGRRHLKKTHELSRRFCGNGNVCSLYISAQVTDLTRRYTHLPSLVNKKALFVAARFIIDNQMNPVKESGGRVFRVFAISKKELPSGQKMANHRTQKPGFPTGSATHDSDHRIPDYGYNLHSAISTTTFHQHPSSFQNSFRYSART